MHLALDINSKSWQYGKVKDIIYLRLHRDQ
jgi:hypothetical protein